jgi:hypothetical protein
MTLYRQLGYRKIPVVARMTLNSGLATLLREETHRPDAFEKLHAFGLLDRTCTPEILLGGANEIIARAIHADYVQHQKSKGETPRMNPSLVSWEDLADYLKESNRQQADHIGVKLKTVGCSIAPLTDWDADLFQFTQEEVEKLAEMEHERWFEERSRNGWKYGKDKNIKRKISTDMIQWDRLTPEAKEKDRNTVRALPAFLEKAGFKINRIK